MKTAGKLLIVVYHIISYAIIAAAVVLGGLFLIGIRPYAVKTGSMEPAIQTGSVCFVDQRVKFEEIREGDIIAFKAGEMLVTHRAVGVDGDGITTRGDANNTDDAAKVTKEGFIGKTVFWLPHIGRIMLYGHTSDGKIILVKNTGTADCFVRMYIEFSDSRMTELLSDDTTNRAEVSDKENPTNNDFYSWADFKSAHEEGGSSSSKWVYVPNGGLGGYFYYTEILAPNAETEPIITKIRTDYENYYDISDFEVIAYSETVQTTEINANGTVYTDAQWQTAWKSFLRISP